MEEKESELGTCSSRVEEKKHCCCCSATMGVLVIVFAWWHVSWAPIALTVLGASIILKEVIKKCCKPTCKTGN